MSSIAPDQQAIIKELYSRRESLDPQKRAIVDELGSRMGLGQLAPSLVASRQAASQSEYESNLPEYMKPTAPPLKTTLAAPLDFGIGVEQMLGIDPMHPITSLPKAAGGMLEGLGRLAGTHGPLGQLEAAKGIATAPARAVAEGGQAIREGNVPKMFQAIGGGYATGKPLVEGLKSTGRYIKDRPARLGQTPRGAVTGLPLKPEPQPMIEIGKTTGNIPVGATPTYQPPTNTLANALSIERLGEEAPKMKAAINEALPDIKHAQQNNPFQRGPFRKLDQFGNTLKWARDRVWNQSIQPLLKGSMETAAIKQRFINNVSPVVKQFFPEAASPIVKKFSDIFDAYPEMDVSKIEDLAKTLRAQLDLSQGPFALFDEMAGSKTSVMKALEQAVRDTMYEHVNLVHNTDIRPAMRSYGNLSGIERLVRDVPEPTSFVEKAISSYTFPTKRAVAARLGEQAAKHVLGTVWRINRALNKYSLDESLVTPIAEPRIPSMMKLPSMKMTVAEQLAAHAKSGVPNPLPANPPIPSPLENTGFSDMASRRHPVTGEILMPELPPPAQVGTTPGSPNMIEYGGKYYGEGPVQDLAGKQGRIAEHALPPEDFHIGKTGVVAEGPDGAKQVRDYRNQRQLFSIEQTPPPRWEPTMRATSTLSDLTAMRAEIIRYLERSDISAAARREYIADVRAIQAEITRRQQARRAGAPPVP